MANSVWVQKQSMYCDRVNQTVHLLEERVYPSDRMPDVGEPFRIHSQKCSAGMLCNLHGYRCRWSGLNPAYDPFTEVRANRLR